MFGKRIMGKTGNLSKHNTNLLGMRVEYNILAFPGVEDLSSFITVTKPKMSTATANTKRIAEITITVNAVCEKASTSGVGELCDEKRLYLELFHRF